MTCEMWTLTKTVTVKEPDEKHHLWRAEDESWEFSDFGEARDAFRRLARECATTEGNVFDGDGNIRNLQSWFDWIDENREEQMRDPKPSYALGSMFLRGAPEIALMAGDFESARAMPSALRAWLLDMGAYDANPLPEFKWTDWCLGFVSKRDSLAVGGISDDDRIELFDAQVYTNAFDMSDPDGDYELSIRAMFDAYDSDAGALRIRLVRGSAAEGGHYAWPEERDDWPAFLDEPAPCLGGAFDGNGSITVHVRPGRDGERSLADFLVEGYEGFVDDVAAIAGERGLAVDFAQRSRDPEGEGASDRIHCYRAGDAECWSRLRIWVHYDLHPPKPVSPPAHLNIEPRKRDDPPIWVSSWLGQRRGKLFEDYPEALAEVGLLIDEHAESAGKPRDPAEERPKVIMIDVVCNLGEGGRSGLSSDFQEVHL